MNEIFIRLATWAAIGGALLSVGFSAGVNFANRDHSKRMAGLESKRQKEAIVVDRIVTEYVEKIITREVPVYVKNDDDCDYVSDAFRVFVDNAAADKGLPEAAGPVNEAPALIETVAQ
jgi:hypothetical protein